MSKFEIIFDDTFDDKISKLEKENEKLKEEIENLRARLRYKGMLDRRPLGVTAEDFARCIDEQVPGIKATINDNEVTLSTPSIYTIIDDEDNF